MNAPDDFRAIKACRVCSGPNLNQVLAFGEQPLANSLKPGPEAVEAFYPLTLCICADCGLVQIRETVSPERLFSHYVWVTQTSATARRFADVFAERLIQLAGLQAEDFVLEVASNDGTYLRPFLTKGFSRVLGIDPAANIVSAAQAEGVPCFQGFWNLASARRLLAEKGRAKAIFARNVIPHIAQLQEAAEGFAVLLAEQGVGAIEFHYAAKILEGLQYDSIYHEHLCYFSLATIEHLLKRYGLQVFHAEASPISGGALIVYFSPAPRTPSEAVQRLRQAEIDTRLNQPETWAAFGQRCREHRQACLEAISGRNRKLVAYGASARSSTFLNFCGLNQQQIQAVIDNNPLKQGLYTPGSTIEIVAFEDGMALNPDTLLLLAWNFQDEIVEDCRRRGYQGAFWMPFPGRLTRIEAEA